MLTICKDICRLERESNFQIDKTALLHKPQRPNLLRLISPVLQANDTCTSDGAYSSCAQEWMQHLSGKYIAFCADS
jgi:hypothetical protein